MFATIAGKYLAFAEAESKGSQHLSQLAESGITHVQCLGGSAMIEFDVLFVCYLSRLHEAYIETFFTICSVVLSIMRVSIYTLCCYVIFFLHAAFVVILICVSVLLFLLF